MYWHDSDPGADRIFGTGDDGDTHAVTTADVEFGFNLLKYQENVRYMTQWMFVAAVEVIDSYTFNLYEERRFLFSFEGHDVSVIGPKHLWETFIFGTWANNTACVHMNALELTRYDGTTGYADCWEYYSQNDTCYANHHEDWEGWKQVYMEDPTDPLGRDLTYLIGFGPFKYHIGGWEPGSYVHVDAQASSGFYHCGHICTGDINFNEKCEVATEDLWKVMRSAGPYGAWNYLVEADITGEGQLVDLDEVYAIVTMHPYGHSGHYWGPDPVASGFVRCPEID
jgi:hypothetical protein